MTHILISASKHIHIGKDPSTNGQWGLRIRLRAILETDVMAAILMMLISMVINRIHFCKWFADVPVTNHQCHPVD